MLLARQRDTDSENFAPKSDKDHTPGSTPPPPPPEKTNIHDDDDDDDDGSIPLAPPLHLSPQILINPPIPRPRPPGPNIPRSKDYYKKKVVSYLLSLSYPFFQQKTRRPPHVVSPPWLVGWLGGYLACNKKTRASSSTHITHKCALLLLLLLFSRPCWTRGCPCACRRA